MTSRRAIRPIAVVVLPWLASSCIIAPPLVDPVVFDSAPFYFPDGLDPDPNVDVVLDLAAGDQQAFAVQVYEWDPDDTLTYRWTYSSSDFSGELGSGELTAPTPVGDGWVHVVPPVDVTTCGGFLRRDGDVLLLTLEIEDPIPPDQRIDQSADTYAFNIDWRVVASGECR